MISVMAPRRQRSADPPDVLTSWKEIAAYLDRGVRTVQRWEKELGLPVQHPNTNRRSTVIAIRSEVDAWLKRAPLATLPIAPNPQKPLSSVALRNRELRVSLRKAVRSMVATLGKLQESVRNNKPEQQTRTTNPNNKPEQQTRTTNPNNKPEQQTRDILLGKKETLHLRVSIDIWHSASNKLTSRSAALPC
jgi:Sec-independent protein translocase protein TatA